MEVNVSNKRTAKSIVNVAISNIIKLFSSVLVAFLIPKIMGVKDYGLYKTFTLYATYVGIFQLGFTDGLYLKYGDKDYSNLDRNRFSFYSLFFILSQFLFLFGFFVFGFLAFNRKYLFITSMLGAYLLTTNLIAYYQMISQITLRFGELSIRNIVQSVLNILSVVLLYVLYKKNNSEIPFQFYVIAINAISFILCIWYILSYRAITFSKPICQDARKEIIGCVRIGFPLMIANLCSTLILIVDRQFVNILFDNATYAVYAFAYNLLALITTLTSAISIVLYPTMKRENKDVLVQKYPAFCSLILMLVFLCCAIYFPLTVFIKWFLPSYKDSLPIFRVLLPGLSVQSVITIIMHNYYKNDLKEVAFFVKSIIILAVSFLANFVAYYVFRTTISISIASVCVMVFWYFLIEEYMVRQYKTKWKKNLLYLSVMMIAFYFSSWWDCWWASMLIYCSCFAMFTFLFYRERLLKFIKQFKAKTHGESKWFFSLSTQ